MLPILATFVILLVFGIGDMVATKTKAIVSMLFLSSVIFLAGFWTKVLPNTMFDDSTLLLVSGVLVTMLLVHMGTTIKLRDFADQWKTVIIAAAACIAISLGIYFLGGLIVSDRNYVIVGAPSPCRMPLPITASRSASLPPSSWSCRASSATPSAPSA